MARRRCPSALPGIVVGSDADWRRPPSIRHLYEMPGLGWLGRERSISQVSSHKARMQNWELTGAPDSESGGCRFESCRVRQAVFRRFDAG